MKKYNIYKTAVCAFVLGLSLSSCGGFLDQPDNSNYNADTFYNGDAECYQGANSLYSMPWYDFQRGFFKVGIIGGEVKKLNTGTVTYLPTMPT